MKGKEAYKVYETLLRALHVLIALGMGDDYEADLIREAMDGCSQELSHKDIQKLDKLSGDLYDRRRRKNWMKKYIFNEMFISAFISGVLLGFAIALVFFAV
jgi:hypothetical protein